MSLTQEMKLLSSQVAASFTPEQKQLFDSFLADLQSEGLGLKPLEPGQEMPPFSLPHATGGLVSSADLLVRGPLVVVFYRGAWCPWCNLQLKAIQDSIDEIHELGAELVAISPMTPDNSLSFSEKQGLTYPVLSDKGLSVARKFGLVYPLKDHMVAFHEAIGVDLAQYNGPGADDLLVPATYIVDDGIVVSRVDPDFRERMDPLEVIAALSRLGK